MRRFITSVSVDTLTLEGVAELTGLDFLDPADLTDLPGPFVYVLADPHGAVFYPGKSEATHKASRRTMAYAKWTAAVSEHVRQFGRPDPSEDPQTGDLSMVHWSPIVRSARRYSLLVKAAQVPDPETASARVWEARIQALEHLNMYNRYYLPTIEKSLAIVPKEWNAWFVPGFFGNYFTKMMAPNNVYEIKF